MFYPSQIELLFMILVPLISYSRWRCAWPWHSPLFGKEKRKMSKSHLWVAKKKNRNTWDHPLVSLFHKSDTESIMFHVELVPFSTSHFSEIGKDPHKGSYVSYAGNCLFSFFWVTYNEEEWVDSMISNVHKRTGSLGTFEFHISLF